MLTYKKDDFDESLDDIMKTAEKIISGNQNEEEQDQEKGKLEKK